MILLVEDQKDDVILIRRAFRQLGITNSIYAVDDGEQAVEYLSGTGKFANRAEYPLPGLVLLDLKLPRQDGLEVLKWIREQPSLRALRVIVLTSSKLREDVNRAYQLGANSFMIKPSDFKRFMSDLEALARYWLLSTEAPDVSRTSPEIKRG